METNEILVIALLLAYLPIFWWLYTEYKKVGEARKRTKIKGIKLKYFDYSDMTQWY